MNILKITVLTAIVIAGAAAALMIEREARAGFSEREGLLRQQTEQLAALKTEQERLAKLAAQSESSPVEDHSAELARLRSEAEALRQRTNELARQPETSRAVMPARPASAPQSHSQEYWDQVHQMAGSKSTEARDLGMAFRQYADDHQGQSPSSVDELASYLAKNNRSLSGSNQFEIVYHGSMDDLKGLPEGTIAVVRDQQIWITPDGKPMRVYGMANGSGQMISSDDNFQAWEARHVISARKGVAGQ